MFHWFSDMGLVRKAVLETLRGSSFQVTLRGKRTQSIMARQIHRFLLITAKHPRAYQRSNNNTSFAITSVINYIIRENLYLNPEIVRFSLQFALRSRCEKLPVVIITSTPSLYLQFETTVKKISNVCITNKNTKGISSCMLDGQLWGISLICQI